ncbi:FadR/GntR family transcriptional regulator [Streptomyces sp. SL13]|uniref:FadR/GntR family transcriptional regulator n=1 Tax=Streptantibioticus silvisoli TaxID=2705255 RepID=A0AA90KHA5_9ACTN|nr:FadR/GntR family transcriptional regulator [Streptantibioticus silvisoli]MDI5971174.1 FadR/GntR family transcriptional regulator [Streptantibioticus silvisoli]
MPPQRKPLEAANRGTRGHRPTVQDQLIELIVELDLDAGEALPPETELTRTLGVSRNSVREALKSLQALGIVDIRHGYGTYVGTGQLHSLQPGLLFHTRLAMRRANPRVLHDIVEVRELLESGLIRRSALELTTEDIDRLEAELRDLAADGDDGRAGHDRRFHELLYEPLGNVLVLQLIGLFWDVYRRLEHEVGKPRTDHDQVVRQHRRVVDALRSRDPDAAAATIRDHFADVTHRIDRWSAGHGGTSGAAGGADAVDAVGGPGAVHGPGGPGAVGSPGTSEGAAGGRGPAGRGSTGGRVR